MNKWIVFALVLSVISASVMLAFNMHLSEAYVSIVGGVRGTPYYEMEDPKTDKSIHFDLVDPECAPPEMVAQILLGYHIMLDTKTYAPDYAGNKIDCKNCHFNGGNTLGGKNRGISLVGVTEIYPRFSKRDNKNITLIDRINNCFKRSLNGKSLPLDSKEMEALVAYLTWISHQVADAPMLPWLGLDNVPSKHTPNATNGKLVYESKCSICHGKNGEGYLTEIPPLWGDQSFNDGAGMSTLPMLSSFIWQNMPHGQPVLSPEESLDVAAYIISQPRPHFKPNFAPKSRIKNAELDK